MIEIMTGVSTNILDGVKIDVPLVNEEDTEGLNDAEHQGGTGLPDPRIVNISSSKSQYERIVRDMDVLGGEPHIRGTRLPIAVILDGLAEGTTPEELMEHYPRLTMEDIRAAHEYMVEKTFWPGG
jgi:uncharacterized protein (DUF433 family)